MIAEEKRMVKYLFGGMIIIGFLLGAASGRLEAVNAAVLSSAARAAELSFSMVGAYALWLGLLQIAQDAGLVGGIAKLLKRPLLWLFPQAGKDKAASGMIALNLTANMLGMGNAATPFGLKAMGELKRLSGRSETASDEMCMFLILNTASVQLLPLSVIALRQAAGSANPAEIILPALIATLITAIFGVIGAKLCAAVFRK